MANETHWHTLARALRELHRALVERARSDYLRENLIGGDLGAGELLLLLTTDPQFEWLRGLSELMVDVDLVRDTHGDERESVGVRDAVEYFISPPTEGEQPTKFAERYWPYVQSDPHVAMAHAHVKQTLSAWPAPARVEREHLREQRLLFGDRAHERP
jgi:hypothetical protein